MQTSSSEKERGHLEVSTGMLASACSGIVKRGQSKNEVDRSTLLEDPFSANLLLVCFYRSASQELKNGRVLC